MALRGRKPTPTPLKILRGTRADRIPADEPVAPPGRPKCPSHLDGVAKAEWRRFVPILEEMRVLTEADGAALAIYCAAFSRWRAARQEIKKHGLLVGTGMGGVKTNPAVTIAQMAEAQMARSLAEFGCTPSSRSRVKVRGEETRDALGEFLARKGRA